MLLRLSGYEVHVAHAGTEALELAREVQPDACILDIGMPGLSGYDLAQALRAEPWGQSLLLIAVTGWGQQKDVARARDAGFDHHFTKPVDAVNIERALAEHDRKLAGSRR